MNEEKMREDFEKDAERYGYELALANCPCCKYEIEATNHRWYGWEAAIAHAEASHSDELRKLKDEYDECRADHQKITLDLIDQLSAARADNEQLRQQVSLLRDALIHHQKLTRPIYKSIQALTDTQATAEAFVAECEQRGAVKALEKIRNEILSVASGYDFSTSYGEGRVDSANQCCDKVDELIRATSKKG